MIYSEDSVRKALDSAIGIIRAKAAERDHANLLKTVIENINGGVLTVDGQGKIIECNNNAETILGIERHRVIGKAADTIFPELLISEIIQSKEEALNQIRVIRETSILSNCVPMFVDGRLTGVVVTFQPVSAIQESDREIRKALYHKGFAAKNTFDDIQGPSRALRETKEIAELYAKSLSTIMLRGESGTGKELFAQSIHNASARRNRPFVAVNCAALPEQLLQSELFGYEEGSFTGARKGGKPGLFEMADRGSIFMDEIGEIPLTTQALLLRVLETREVMRLGGEKLLPVDVRIICATNRNLWRIVKEGNFREDLYYRLSILEIEIPPLRRRKEDIPALAAVLLAELRADLDSAQIAKISSDPRLQEYDWPGNVRELRNVLERFAALFVPGKSWTEVLDKLFSKALLSGNSEKDDILQRISETLDQTQGSRKRAADALGISRTTLWRKLNQRR